VKKNAIALGIFGIFCVCSINFPNFSFQLKPYDAYSIACKSDHVKHSGDLMLATFFFLLFFSLKKLKCDKQAYILLSVSSSEWYKLFVFPSGWGLNDMIHIIRGKYLCLSTFDSALVNDDTFMYKELKEYCEETTLTGKR